MARSASALKGYTSKEVKSMDVTKPSPEATEKTITGALDPTLSQDIEDRIVAQQVEDKYRKSESGPNRVKHSSSILN